MRAVANRRQRRRARKLGRRPRFSRRLTVIAALVVLGLLAMTARVLGDDSGVGVDSTVQGDAAVAVMSDEELTEAIRIAAERHEVPGIAAAIVDGDRTLARAHWGRRASDLDVAVTAEDLWHIGSCTKAMTATLAACLVADRALAWEMTLADLITVMAADAPVALADSLRNVTLEDLLAMRGGLPSAPPALAWMTAYGDARSGSMSPRRQREKFVGSVLEAATGPAGSFEYSNQGYAVVGTAIETVTNEEFESLLVSRLAAPLGMTTMGFGAPETPDTLLQQPRGHRADGTPMPPGTVTDNPPAIAPAGRVHLSIEDWARFARAHLRGARHGSAALRLESDAFQRLHRSRGDDDEPYALGWIVRADPRFGTVLWHNGSNTMWYAEMWLAPERDIAVLLVCNRGMPAGEQAVADARRAILDQLKQRLAAQKK